METQPCTWELCPWLAALVGTLDTLAPVTLPGAFASIPDLILLLGLGWQRYSAQTCEGPQSVPNQGSVIIRAVVTHTTSLRSESFYICVTSVLRELKSTEDTRKENLFFLRHCLQTCFAGSLPHPGSSLIQTLSRLTFKYSKVQVSLNQSVHFTPSLKCLLLLGSCSRVWNRGREAWAVLHHVSLFSLHPTPSLAALNMLLLPSSQWRGGRIEEQKLTETYPTLSATLHFHICVQMLALSWSSLWGELQWYLHPPWHEQYYLIPAPAAPLIFSY